MIGFGVDGVGADFNSVFRQVILDETGYDINGGPQDKFEIEVPGLTNKDMWRLVNKTINRYALEMQPYPGAAEAIWRLYDETREPIQFVTARQAITRDATERWINEYLIVPHEVASVRSKDKCTYLKDHGFTHFIDDRYRTVQQVKQCVPYTFLMDRPWNQREAVGVYRVFDLIDYVTEYLNWRNN